MKRLTYDYEGKHFCDYTTREIINRLAECEIMLEKIEQILKDIPYGGDATVRRIQDVVEHDEYTAPEPTHSFPNVEGERAEIFYKERWNKGTIVAGYRFRDGIVSIKLDDTGEVVWCGQDRTDCYRKLEGHKTKMSEREHHIEVLEKLLKETEGKIELYSENKNVDLRKEKEIVETLGYAISSLKTDLKYDLMYEGEEIYTKADMVDILTEIQTEIEEMPMYYDPMDVSDSIQQKIDKYKTETKPQERKQDNNGCIS